MTDADALRVEYAVGLPDLLALVERNIDPVLTRRVSTTRLAITLVVGILVALFAVIAVGPADWWIALGIGAAVALVWWLVLPHDVQARALRRMEQRLQEPSNASMTGPRTLLIDAREFALIHPLADLHYRWAAIQRVVVTPGRLFVYVSGMQAHVLPLAGAEAASVIACVRKFAPTVPVVESGAA